MTTATATATWHTLAHLQAPAAPAAPSQGDGEGDGEGAARWGHASTLIRWPCVAGDAGAEMAVFGGFDGTHCLDDLRVLSTSSWTWRSLYPSLVSSSSSSSSAAPILWPSPRSHHSMVQLEHFLVIFGGRVEQRNSHDSDHAMDATLCVYDLEQQVWVQPDLSASDVIAPSRQYHSAVVFGRRMLVFGGRRKDEELGVEVDVNDLWELVYLGQVRFAWRCVEASEHVGFVLEEERQRSPMTALGGGAASPFGRGGSSFFSHGPLKPKKKKKKKTKKKHKHKHEDDKLHTAGQPVQPLNAHRPRPRSFHTATKLGSCMLVFGGCHGRRYQSLGDVWLYNVEDGTWSRPSFLTPPGSGRGTQPAERWGHSVVPFGAGVLVVYGRGKNGDLADVWLLARRSNLSAEELHAYGLTKPVADAFSWTKVAVSGDTIPSARRRHTCVLAGSQLLLYGGYDGKYYNDLYALDVSNVGPAPSPAAPVSRFTAQVPFVALEPVDAERLAHFLAQESVQRSVYFDALAREAISVETIPLLSNTEFAWLGFPIGERLRLSRLAKLFCAENTRPSKALDRESALEQMLADKDRLIEQAQADKDRQVEELEERLQDLEEINLCRICEEQVIELVLVPCGHPYCTQCLSLMQSHKWTQCSICREPWQDTQRVFLQ